MTHAFGKVPNTVRPLGSKPPAHPVKCFCGAPMKLKTLKKTRIAKDIWFYGCTRWPECDGSHSCHQDTGLPMGRPADKATKRSRMAAHAAFDSLWKVHGWNRKKAYRWLRQELGLSHKEGHIAMFDIPTCLRLIEAVGKLKLGG